MELQVVKMKFRTIGRPSFISSGSETTLPSSRTRRTAGTAYVRIDLIGPLAAGAGAENPSSAAFANPPEAASTRSATPVSAARRTRTLWRPPTAAGVGYPLGQRVWGRRRGWDCGIMDRGFLLQARVIA